MLMTATTASILQYYQMYLGVVAMVVIHYFWFCFVLCDIVSVTYLGQTSGEEDL